MKCILLLVAVLALQAYASPLTEEQKQKLKDFSKECISETGVDVDKVKQLRENKVIGDDDKMKDYIVCFYKKMGLMNAEGEIQKDRLKKGLNKAITDAAKVDEVVDKCAKQKSTPQETAVALFNCIKEEAAGEWHH